MDDITPIVDLPPQSLSPPDAPPSASGDLSPPLRSGSDDDITDLDELTYRSVPFKVVGHRKVVYRHIGPLPPMKYEYEEDAE